MGPLDELPPDTWNDGPTLADLTTSVSTALGFGDLAPLTVPAGHTVVVLLIDGLGEVLLQEHSVFAPTLSRHRTTTLRAGFPSTTATSLTSLGTGLCAGEHGIIGYSFAPRDLESAARHTLNALRWTLDTADGPDASRLFPPAVVQPMPSTFDELAQGGAEVVAVLPGAFRGSGLTRAAYGSPADYRDGSSPEAVLGHLRDLLAEGDRGPRLIYAYVPELDAAGHKWGPGTPEWRERLRLVDSLVREVIALLPAGATLVATGDHGMISAGRRIDLDTDTEFTEGTVALGGEARVRHVYAEPGAARDVLAAWAALLDGDAHIASREQVIDEGWFGPAMATHVADRIGDVVAVGRRDVLLTRSLAEPIETRMPGHHGGWTAAELLVPLIVAAG